MLAFWLALQNESGPGAEVAAGAAQTVHDGAQAAANGAAHGGGHEAAGIPELPNFFGVIHHALGKAAPDVADKIDSLVVSWGITDNMVTPFQAFENLLFALLAIIGLSIFFISSYRRIKCKPPKDGKLSSRAMFCEVIVLFFDDFFSQILGKKEARKHLGFVGTLFIYILVLNVMGLMFLGKSPTSNLSFNVGMALIVFFYVHITGISRNPLGYLKHYPGALPTIKELGMGPVVGSFLIGFMAILFIIIHIMEAIIQPVSLSLRLFGNILGKEVLLGVFGSLLVIGASTSWGGVALPLHTPFLFLGLLLGAIQALIFSLLSAVYIMLWLPHEHEHAEGH